MFYNFNVWMVVKSSYLRLTTIYSWVVFFCFVGGNPRYVFILYTKNMKKIFLFGFMAILLVGFWFGGASLAADYTWSLVSNFGDDPITTYKLIFKVWGELDNWVLQGDNIHCEGNICEILANTGKEVQLPEPVLSGKESCTFAGWYSNYDDKKKWWVWDTFKVTSTTTLYAKWLCDDSGFQVRNQHFDTFEAALAALSSKYNDKIVLLQDVNYAMTEEDTFFRIEKNGHNITVTPAEWYVMNTPVETNGYVEYKQVKFSDQMIEITKANGAVSYSTSFSLLNGDWSTVKLLKDNAVVTSIPNAWSSLRTDADVTLDLSWYTLNLNTTMNRNYAMSVTEWNTLTIKNGTIEIAPTNDKRDNWIIVEKWSTLNIGPDVTINAHNWVSAVTVFWDVTLNLSWTLTAENSFVIAGNGSDWNEWYTINIDWGSVIETTNTVAAIYHPNDGTLNISTWTIQWSEALYIKSWETNISGGKFIGKGAKADFSHNGNWANPTWDWVVVEVCDYPGGEPTINITAWEFESDKADSIASYAQEGYTALTGFLVWWIFSPEPDESYISDGYYAKEIDDDKYEITEVQTIDTIDITSETTGVYVWELPEFEATTTTSWLDVSVYWSNTNWAKRPGSASSWQWFWAETPTAVADGTTHYALRLQLNKDEWYVFGDDVTINFNWIDWTASGHTLLDKWFTWWGYLYIDLGIAIVLPTEISAISLSGSATISLWDDLDLLEVENVEDPMTVWYGYSSYLPVKWTGDARTDVDTAEESAVAWTNYWLKVNLNIEDNFQLSTNPTLIYNGENWTTSGHTIFDLENNAIYIDLWTAAAEEPRPDVEELLVPGSWTTASAWGIDDISLDNAEATTGFDANDYAWVTTPQVIIQQKTDSAALQEEWTTETKLENDLTNDFVTDTGKIAEMQGILDIKLYYLDWSGNSTLLSGVQFSDPVKIMIPVAASVSAVEVRADHWDGYGTTWLTLDGTAWCNGWRWVPTANAYTWWDVPVVNGKAEIYTCSASSFVAYTETDKPSPAPSNKTSWWSGGGWSSRTSALDDTKATTWNVAKLDETEVDETKSEENNDEDGAKTDPMIDVQAVAKFGQEQIDAYKWALENGITTMKTVEEARLDDPLTRAELAKMMVVYIQKVLKKDPVVTWDVNYPDVKVEEIWDLVDYVKLAYQYQIMWINADGTPIELFNPHGIVSRWEYATVFSRVLFGAKFNKEGADFYTNHLEALKTAWILTNTLPSIQEMRGWVMLMMYRSSQNGEAIEKVANSTEEIVDEAKAEEIVSEETVNVSDEEKSEGWIDTAETTKDSTEESVSDESSETPVNTAETTTWDTLSE